MREHNNRGLGSLYLDSELDPHQLLVRELERERVRPVPPRPAATVGEAGHQVAETPAGRLAQLNAEVEEYESANKSRAQLRVLKGREVA